MEGPRRYSGSFKVDYDLDDYDLAELDEPEEDLRASPDLWRGLGNWLVHRSWRTAPKPEMCVCRGTDRFGLYHEFVWKSVSLPDTHLGATLYMHVHLGLDGRSVIAGAIWAGAHKGNELKRHDFPELDELAQWLQGQFPNVWNGRIG